MSGPLAGLRGVVLTQVWAGPIATQLLALLGADVIQVESRQRVDPMRGGSWDVEVPPRLKERPSAEHGWNCSSFNSHNLNKRSLTLDLSRPRGLELFKELLQTADFFVENYSPRVMANFRLDAEELRRVNPDLIVVNMGAFGHFGLYWNAPGTGGQVEPMAGGTQLLGYEDGPPIGSGQLWCDPVSGYHAAAAVLTALYYRKRTGIAQRVDVSMQEACASFHADALIEYGMLGRVRRRMGNRHVSLAPHNTYGTRDGQWLSLAVRSEDEWLVFCRVASHPEWVADPRFAKMALRKRNEAALDETIAEWTAENDALTLEDGLSAAGLAAAKVRSPSELQDLPQFRERGFVQTVEHPETGPLQHFTAPFHMSATPPEVTSPSPTHGQHSWEILSSLIDREEYDRLVAEGITGEGPPPEWSPGSIIGRSMAPRGAS